jgi:Outer membrane protein beta-barrel domain
MRLLNRTGTLLKRSLLVALVLAISSISAHAQAWVPPAGIGLVSVVYQSINNTNHRLTDGSLFDGFDSLSRGVLLNLDYSFTDRFSISVGVPYLGSKYTGPEPSLFALAVDDCFCWNHGWQDFGFTARYNLANDRFALTPSISMGVPTHNYDYFGEAVLGRNLKEFRLQVDVGQRLDAISDRLSVSGRYSYAIVEEVLELPNNRSNMAVEAGFMAARKLATRFGVSWQRSHGGLRSTEVVTEEQYSQWDRILKDNNFHITGGVSYSLPKVDAFASYVHYADGTDTHVGRAITAGLSFPFER